MAESDLEEGEEKKSSKLMMIIIIVVVLLGGGGAGYYFMMGDSTEVDGENVEAVEEEAVEEEEEEVLGEEAYYDLGKPLIVNFPKGSSANLIQVSVSLLVKDELAIDSLKKHEPMMRNNLLMAISAKGSANLRTKEGKEELRAEILNEVGEVMKKMTGKNKVLNVFFTTFVMQ